MPAGDSGCGSPALELGGWAKWCRAACLSNNQDLLAGADCLAACLPAWRHACLPAPLCLQEEQQEQADALQQAAAAAAAAQGQQEEGEVGVQPEGGDGGGREERRREAEREKWQLTREEKRRRPRSRTRSRSRSRDRRPRSRSRERYDDRRDRCGGGPAVLRLRCCPSLSPDVLSPDRCRCHAERPWLGAGSPTLRALPPLPLIQHLAAPPLPCRDRGDRGRDDRRRDDRDDRRGRDYGGERREEGRRDRLQN